MDYDAVVLVKFYRPNAEGGYDPVVFPTQSDIYVRLQLGSNMWQAFSVPLPEALEAGEYGLELLIANDFHSLSANDYFIFASGPLTVSSSTGIENTMATDVKDDTWYTLNGRRLQGKPTTKGIYIYKGKKQIIK